MQTHITTSLTVKNVAELTFWGEKTVIRRGYKNAYVYSTETNSVFTLIVETLLSYYWETHIQCMACNVGLLCKDGILYIKKAFFMFSQFFFFLQNLFDQDTTLESEWNSHEHTNIPILRRKLQFRLCTKHTCKINKKLRVKDIMYCHVTSRRRWQR